MNCWIGIGNLVRDPELRTTKDGISVCSFTLAVNDRKKKDENGQPKADFFKVVAWRQLGENCGKFLTKGSKASVKGSISLKSYKGQDGVDRYNMEVTADDVEFLSNKSAPKGDADDSGLTYTPPEDQAKGFTCVETDQLPF